MLDAGSGGSGANPGFVRSIGLLVRGTVLAHAITAIGAPVLTRLYGPADFNAAAVFTSVLMIISVASCLRFDVAIAMAEDEREAADLLALACGVALLVGLGTGVAMAFPLPAEVKPAGHGWLMPFGVTVGGFYLALQMWFVRKKHFAAVSNSRIVQSAASFGGQGALGIWGGGGPLGLMLAQPINFGVGTLVLGGAWLRGNAGLLRGVRWAGIAAVFKRHERFPRYSTWEALANAASINLPVVLIAHFAIGPEAGYLALAIMLLQAPAALLGSAVGQVYLSEAPRAYREGRLAPFTLEAVERLLMVAVGPFLCIAIVSPWVFEFVFGAGWARAGVIAAWLSPWFLLQFIVSPVSTALHVIGRQSTAMALQIAGLAIRVGAVVIVGVAAPRWVTEAYALSGALLYFLYIAVVFHALALSAASIVGPLLRAVPLALAGAIVGAIVALIVAGLHHV